MDTALLDTFVMVADAGGLAAAGSMMGIPQSIVSRRIKELETLCGAPLFYRHGRGVKLTPAGDTLYQSAQPLIAQFAAVLSTIADQQTKPAGALSVAITPALLSATGVRIIDAMDRQFPGITVELVGGYSRYVLEWLLQSRVDIGILTDLGLSSQLITEQIGTARVILVARPDFDLPTDVVPGEIDFASLGGVPLIVPSKGQGLRRHIDQAATRHGVNLNIAYEINDIELARELAATGRAASFLSRPAVRKELANGTLVEKGIHGEEMTARWVLATARNRPITPAMKATIGVLKSELAAVLAEAG